MNKITFTPAFPELKNVVPLPEPATKNVPNWYKEQPAKIDNEIQNGVMKLTVKKCQSFFVKKNFKGILKQGTPLIQVFPFKRDDWEMSINKEVNSEEISEQRIMLRSTFENGYKMKYWVKKLFK